MYKVFYLLLFLISFQAFGCEVLNMDMRVVQDSNFSSLNETYHVEIDVWIDASASCAFDSSHQEFTVWTTCGEKLKPTADIIYTESIGSGDFSCFPMDEFVEDNFRHYKLRGSFSLSDSWCSQILVYYQYGQQSYRNVWQSDTLPVPVSTWVQLYGTYWDTTSIGFAPNRPYLRDTQTTWLEACVGYPKTYRPAIKDPDGDSLTLLMSKVSWFDTSAAGYPPMLERGFTTAFNPPNFNPTSPFPNQNFGVEDWMRVSFEAADTGLFALPMLVNEWRHEQVGAIHWYRMSVSYKQVPVMVGSQCYSHLPNEAFKTDTIPFHCADTTLKVTINGMVDPRSVSSDGSDFRFHHAEGYPGFIHSARAKHPYRPYADTVILEVEFLFDGEYELELVAGADGNSMIGECGYEMAGQRQVVIQATGCEADVGLAADLRNGEVNLYPNPASDLLMIESPTQISSIGIRSISGAEYPSEYVKRGPKKWEVNLAGLPAGVYVLEIQTEAVPTKSFKVVKF